MKNKILNRKIFLEYISPPSENTINTFSSEKSVEPPDQIKNILNDLDSLQEKTNTVKELLKNRAKNIIIKLDLSNPEDYSTAVAAAALFPERATEINIGEIKIPVVTELDSSLLFKTLDKLREAGIDAASKQNPTKSSDFNKTDFGGINKNRSPNNPNFALILPLDVPAFILGTLPLLYNLVNPFIKANILGHTHIDPVSGVTGPGVPAVP